MFANLLATLGDAKRLTDWMRETADPRLDNPHDDRWDKAPYDGGRPTGTQIPKSQKRADFKILDGQPTRLYFTGNLHHPTFGREKLAALLDRYFDGKSPIVVDGLADARKDPITQQPIRPAKIPELIRFLEPHSRRPQRQQVPPRRPASLRRTHEPETPQHRTWPDVASAHGTAPPLLPRRPA